jgi:hypothetical protein
MWLTSSTVDGYALIWFIDGEEGLRIGEDWHTLLDVSKESVDVEQREDWVCAHIAFSFSPDYLEPFFLWDSRSRAADALRAIKSALKMHRANKPLPEWAQTALAQGWKPPKNWKA